MFVSLRSACRGGVLLSLLREALLYMCLRGRETLQRGAVVRGAIGVALVACAGDPW